MERIKLRSSQIGNETERIFYKAFCGRDGRGVLRQIIFRINLFFEASLSSVLPWSFQEMPFKDDTHVLVMLVTR